MRPGRFAGSAEAPTACEAQERMKTSVHVIFSARQRVRMLERVSVGR